EGMAFLCEVPTGVVADVFSRRLSVIIGVIVVGAGFALEGLVPRFGVILLAQVIWGAGYPLSAAQSKPGSPARSASSASVRSSCVARSWRRQALLSASSPASRWRASG